MHISFLHLLLPSAPASMKPGSLLAQLFSLYHSVEYHRAGMGKGSQGNPSQTGPAF